MFFVKKGRKWQFGYSKAELDATPAEDFAGPHQSYPIKKAKDVKSAWDLAGQSDDPDTVREKIKEIAKRKGWEDKLPATAMSADLTFNDITAALRALLGDDPDGDGDIDYPYVADVMPDESTFVYGCDGKLFEQGYSVDDGGNVSLVGLARPVAARTSYKPVYFADLDADYVEYQGKVFEAGDYPDKGFGITNDELAERASRFGGVDLDLEHSDFKDVLGNKLGRLEKLKVAGAEAFGSLKVPRWLHDLAGGKLQTSLTFDHSKNIVGCALTLSPRIADAQVAAAFAKFAGARHSKGDRELVQQLHDAASSLGATCNKQMGARHNDADRKAIQDTHDLAVQLGADCGTQMSDQRPAGTATGGNVTLKEKLKALFGKTPDAVRELGIDPTEIDRVEFTVPAPALDPRVTAQLAEFKATNDRLIAGQLNTLAAQFSEDQIRSGKAVPAQREHLRSLYKTAAVADGDGVVKFSDNGLVEEGANLKALRDLFANAVPHSMFSTQIPNSDPGSEPGQPNQAMVDRLRGATALGQATKKESK